MENISSEEFKKLALHGRGSSSIVYNSIYNLKINEAIIIRKSEWHPKYNPTSIIRRIEKKYGFKYQYGLIADRSGWAVMRIS